MTGCSQPPIADCDGNVIEPTLDGDDNPIIEVCPQKFMPEFAEWDSGTESGPPDPSDCCPLGGEGNGNFAVDTATPCVSHVCRDGSWVPFCGTPPVPGPGDCPVAVDVTLTDVLEPDVSAVVDASVGDTVCCAPDLTSWAVVPGSFRNVLAVSPNESATGVFDVTAAAQDCTWSFDYTILCNGAPSGQVGTVEGNVNADLFGPNLVSNPDFAIAEVGAVAAGGDFGGGWSSDRPYVGANIYPPDTTVSIQTGQKVYSGGIVNQVPFPGDPVYGVPGSDTWLYSNGNNTGALYKSCEQTVCGVQPGQPYKFYAYTSSAIRPDTDVADDSELQFQIDGADFGPGFVELDHADPASDDNGVDLWHRRAWDWTAPGTIGDPDVCVTFTLLNTATGAVGNDLALTAINFQLVEPCTQFEDAP